MKQEMCYITSYVCTYVFRFYSIFKTSPYVYYTLCIGKSSESDDEMGFDLFGGEGEEISLVLNYV